MDTLLVLVVMELIRQQYGLLLVLVLLVLVELMVTLVAVEVEIMLETI